MRVPRPHSRPNHLELHQLQRLRCIGNSLWPVLLNGDEIEVKPALPTEIRPGDLVAFTQGRMKICHRVLKSRRRVGTTEYFIKGDNTSRPDGWIPYPRLVGKVYELPSARAEWFNRIYRRLAVSQYALLAPLLPHSKKSQQTLLGATSPWLWIPRAFDVRIPDDWVVPPPETEGPRLKSIADDYGHAYHYETLFPEPVSQLSSVFEVGPPKEGAILDLGGGEGRVTRHFVSQGYRVDYVDSSSRMMAAAAIKSAARKKFDRIHWYLTDMRRLPMATRYQTIISKCAVTCLGSEWELGECLVALRQRLLKNGTIWIQISNVESLKKYPEWLTNRWTFERKIESGRKKIWLWRRSRRSPDGKLIWEHALTADRFTYTLLTSTNLMLDLPTWRKIARYAGLEFSGKKHVDASGAKTFHQLIRAQNSRS